MIKAVVFDLDDTLFPEMQFVEQGFEYVAQIVGEKYHLQSVYPRLLQLFEQDHANAYNRLLDSFGVKYCEKDIAELAQEYRSFARTNLQFYPDTIGVLEELRKNNIRIGVITDGKTECQQNKICSLEVEKYVDFVVITDSLGGEKFRKPHPKAFEIMREKLQVEFSEMIYVGDNRAKDFAIGALYPLVTCEISRGDKLYRNKEYYNGVLPKITIKTLTELLEYIRKI
ncbi:MAG: HAD-IA family hydrolase [Clostridia bacterium]